MKNRLRPFWFNTDPVAPAGGGAPAAPAAPAVPAVAPAAPAAPAVNPAVDWMGKAPDTWRDAFVEAVPETQRETARPFFERVPSLQVLANNYIESQQKIRKGLPPEDAIYLPKNHTPEQLADYRTKMNIPASFDKYELALDDGLVLSKEDREFMNPIFAVMHAANVPNVVASTLVNEYLKLDQQNQKDIGLRDEHQKQETELALKRLWGPDFTRNIGLIEMFMQDLPEDVRTAFKGARMADGTAVFNSPDVLQFFLGKMKEINPMATVVPQSGSAGLKSIQDEMLDIESKMHTEAYIKGPLRARYTELLTALEAMKK